MRILLISSRYLPHRGGLESVVHHLAHEFIKHGHVIQMVANRYPRSLPASEVIDGISVKRLNFILPDIGYLKRFRFDLWLAGMWFHFFTPFRLRSILRDFQPDLVNNHYLNEVAEVTGLSLSRVPWVVSLHGGDVDGEPLMSASKRACFQNVTRRAGALTTCSGSLARQAEVLEPSLVGRVETIHNGVDVEKFSNAKPPQNHPPYIFAVGQLVLHKGFDLLISAFASLAEKYPKVELWIAGEGPHRPVLEALIQDDLASRVRLLGRVDEDAVASLMAGALFIAMPSRREPFGIVALEGMAAGKCVLSTPVGGIPEFLPCPPNRLVEPEQTAWVDALDEWLALALSGRLNSEANAVTARKFDWSVTAEHYLQIYKQALAHV